MLKIVPSTDKIWRQCLEAGFIEILLPGGGLVRLSAGIDRALLIDVIRSVSTVLEETRS